MSEQRERVGRVALVGLCATWTLSAAPFFFDASAFADISRTALAALPWIAYAGLPRREGDLRLAEIALEFALFLPPLALGAWIDRAHGRTGFAIGTLAVGSAVALVALSFAARASARDLRVRRIYDCAWIVLVVGVPILAATLALGGASVFGPAPAVLLAIGAASPLTWVTAHFSAETAPTAIPWAPLALTSGLLALGFVARATTAPERAS